MALDSGVQGPCVRSANIWVMGEVGAVILLISSCLKVLGFNQGFIA